MSAHLELEAHLRDHPHDAQGWMVYADWLLDQGDMRGKLIQLELQFAQSPGDFALHTQIAELRAANGWQPSQTIRSGYGTQTLRYGFVHGLSMRGEGQTGKLRKLLERPGMQFLRELELDNLSARGVAALAEMLTRISLRSLRLNSANLPPPKLTKLLPQLRRLETLSLSNTFLNDACLQLLADSPSLGALRSLSLSCSLNEHGVPTLARSKTMSLRSLDLSHNGLQPKSAATLSEAPALAPLTSLHIGFNPISDDGVRALARPGCLPELASLDLSHTQLHREGLEALVRAWSLRSLRLNGNYLTDREAELIAEHLRDLVTLEISDTNIRDEGLLTLVSSLPKLESLGVWNLEVSAEARDEIAALRPDLDVDWHVPSEQPRYDYDEADDNEEGFYDLFRD